MKINSNKFLYFILVLSMIFSSMGVFADDVNTGEGDYEVEIGEYKYYSKQSEGSKLKRIKIDGSENESTEIALSGSATHLISNNKNNTNDEDQYFYFYLDVEGNESGIYKFDTTNDSSDYNLKKIDIIVDSLPKDFSGSKISEMVLTKYEGNDIIFFVDHNPVNDKGLLRKLTLKDGKLTEKFDYDESSEEIEAKDIHLEANILRFTHNEGIVRKPKQINLSDNKVVDITLKDIEVKRKSDSTGELSIVQDGHLKLQKGDKDITLVVDPSPTNENLKWKSLDEKIIKLVTEDKTKATFKVQENATIGDSTNIIIVDSTSGDIKPIRIDIVENQNPLSKVELINNNTIYLKKGETKPFELNLIGEDPSNEVSNIEDSIKSIVITSSNTNFVTVGEIKKVPGEEKISVDITGKGVTSRESEPKLTITIKNNDEFKIESPSIVIDEIVKPKLQIRLATSNEEANDEETPVKTSIDIEQNNSRKFELWIEEDGEFRIANETEGKKVTWSTSDNNDSELVTISPSTGFQTTITTKNKTGAAALIATYKYDDPNFATAEFKVTVIKDEYGDYNRWTDVNKDTITLVNSNKIWTIKFSNALNQDTVNSRNIYIKKRINSTAEELYDDTITYLGNDNKSLSIKPTRPYESGEYFLYIENIKDIEKDKDKNTKGIKDINDNTLNKGIKMKFTVK